MFANIYVSRGAWKLEGIEGKTSHQNFDIVCGNRHWNVPKISLQSSKFWRNAGFFFVKMCDASQMFISYEK